jgi:hypothetical protein
VIAWLQIDGPAPVVLIRNAAARPYVSSSARVRQLLQSLDPLRDSIDGEVASVGAVCDNRARQCVELFAVPPLGVSASVWAVRKGAAEKVFSGVVASVALDGDECRIGLIA